MIDLSHVDMGEVRDVMKEALMSLVWDDWHFGEFRPLRLSWDLLRQCGGVVSKPNDGRVEGKEPQDMLRNEAADKRVNEWWFTGISEWLDEQYAGHMYEGLSADDLPPDVEDAELAVAEAGDRLKNVKAQLVESREKIDRFVDWVDDTKLRLTDLNAWLDEQWGRLSGLKWPIIMKSHVIEGMGLLDAIKLFFGHEPGDDAFSEQIKNMPESLEASLWFELADMKDEYLEQIEAEGKRLTPDMIDEWIRYEECGLFHPEDKLVYRYLIMFTAMMLLDRNQYGRERHFRSASKKDGRVKLSKEVFATSIYPLLDDEFPRGGENAGIVEKCKEIGKQYGVSGELIKMRFYEERDKRVGERSGNNSGDIG